MLNHYATSINVYATTLLSLYEADVDINAEYISKILKMAKITSEKHLAELFIECFNVARVYNLIEQASAAGSSEGASVAALSAAGVVPVTMETPRAAEKLIREFVSYGEMSFRPSYFIKMMTMTELLT